MSLLRLLATPTRRSRCTVPGASALEPKGRGGWDEAAQWSRRLVPLPGDAERADVGWRAEHLRSVDGAGWQGDVQGDPSALREPARSGEVVQGEAGLRPVRP